MKASLLSWTFIALAIAASIISYPDLPEQMAIHWNMSNEIDGLAHKAFALLLLPALMVILIVVLPRKQNYLKHKKAMMIMQNVILFSLLVLHSMTIAFGYGVEINIVKIVLPMVGILLAVTGIYMPRFEPNSYIGIKTNQTLSSEAIWIKTHQGAAKFFVIGGLIMIPAGFLPTPLPMIGFFTIIVIIVLASAFLAFHYGKDNK
ncbi:SdpI family protein [Paenibacillus luteus]|uniref:SdpI family protein n=1 Tax=Paenibacillus luteus TaxID=2545753 RepID=UPI0011444138|nr:SdpI family protein [Paenibacillus luteus]